MKVSWGLCLLLVASGCRVESGDAPLKLLQARFAAHASRVMGEDALVPTSAGFIARTPALRPEDAAQAALSRRGGLRAEFPARGDGAVRFAEPDGFAIEVREAGLSGAGRLEHNALLYSRDGGEGSFWSATSSGYEEWLLVSAPLAGPVAQWDVTGATLRQRGEAIEILDAAGQPRLKVSAPEAFAPSGERVAVRLTAEGTRLSLQATGSASGRLLLVDPIWQVVGAMTAARAFHSATLLTNGKVLVVGGAQGLASAELYDPATGLFTVTGSLTTGRQYHTATLLPSGKVLVVGGYNFSWLNSAELYDPVSGTFTPTGTLQTARYWHTATLLQTGKVLVTGGNNQNGPQTTAELYDPGSGTFSFTSGPLQVARASHTATLLTSGKVLVAGGAGNVAELYDPTSDAFSSIAATMLAVRYNHTATLLVSGKVLVVGGTGGLSSAELFDPAGVGSFTSTGSLVTGREKHSATLLPSGKVLVAGGDNNTPSFQCPAFTEEYDPTTGMFAERGNLWTPRSDHVATLLPSGHVLVTGGYNGSYLASAELFDPQANACATTGPLTTARTTHSATLLASGKVLVAGGSGASGVLASAELYDSAGLAAAPTGNLVTGRQYHTATLLPSGKVLLTGGNTTGGITSSAELYDPLAGKFTATVGQLTTGRKVHTATLLPSGQVLLTGGSSGAASAVNTAELFDPVAGTFAQTIGNMTTARAFHTATLLLSGKVLLAGGNDAAGTTLNSAELFDPATGTFSPAALLTGRYKHAATLLTSGTVLLTGGNTSGGATASSELYDPATDTFALTGPLNLARYLHTATLLPSGQVLVAGGESGGATSSLEVYEPASGVFTQLVSTQLATARESHTATLLQSGQVLLVAGASNLSGAPLGSSELFTDRSAISVPNLTSLTPATLLPGDGLSATGTLFTGASEASGGGTPSSSTGYPLLLLRRVDNEATSIAPVTAFTSTSAAATSPATLIAGPYLAWVVVNGVLSNGASLAVTGFPTGTACAAGSSCATGWCVDGFCCDAACTSACHACSAALSGGANGTCSADLANTDPHSQCNGLTCDGAGACRAHCASDAQCTSTYYCNNTSSGSCKARQAKGLSCVADPVDPTGAHQCSSGFCVDGFCCGAACTSACHACSAIKTGGSDGTCADVTNHTDPDGDCTGSLTCFNGACLTSCTDSSQCLKNHYCAGDGSCQPYKAQGQACNQAAGADCAAANCQVCASSHCVDGYCCNNACGSACDACDGADLGWASASNGTCAVAAAAVWAGAPACTPYLCGGATTCPTTCTTDSACAPGFYCGSANTCQPRKAKGTGCNPAADCKVTGCRDCQAGLSCADGVCCDQACTGTCSTCKATPGTCTTVTGADDPDTCTGASTCDLAGACKLKTGQAAADGATCASGFASDGYCCSSACAGGCDACAQVFGASANGLCTILQPGDPGEGGACAPFVCGGAADCPASCATDADCASDHYCAADASCQPRKDQGVACDLGADCKAAGCRACLSGYCVEGSCCDGACTTPCMGCALAGSVGTCTALPAQSEDTFPAGACLKADGRSCNGLGNCTGSAGALCTSNFDCGSGFCVDGVCCSSACSGNCESCNLDDAHKGTCTPVRDGTDPRLRCQASSGGTVACAGACLAGQCAFPDIGTNCGLCSACDGTGRCAQTPLDDDACGTISCGGLDTACRAYQDLKSGRCASLGFCKEADDPASCTHWTDLPCGADAGATSADAGTTADGGEAQDAGGSEADAGGPALADAGTAQVKQGCGCAASGGGSGSAGVLVLLALGIWGSATSPFRRGTHTGPRRTRR